MPNTKEHQKKVSDIVRENPKSFTDWYQMPFTQAFFADMKEQVEDLKESIVANLEDNETALKLKGGHETLSLFIHTYVTVFDKIQDGNLKQKGKFFG